MYASSVAKKLALKMNYQYNTKSLGWALVTL